MSQNCCLTGEHRHCVVLFNFTGQNVLIQKVTEMNSTTRCFSTVLEQQQNKAPCGLLPAAPNFDWCASEVRASSHLWLVQPDVDAASVSPQGAGSQTPGHFLIKYFPTENFGPGFQADVNYLLLLWMNKCADLLSFQSLSKNTYYTTIFILSSYVSISF